MFVIIGKYGYSFVTNSYWAFVAFRLHFLFIEDRDTENFLYKMHHIIECVSRSRLVLHVPIVAQRKTCRPFEKTHGGMQILPFHSGTWNIEKLAVQKESDKIKQGRKFKFESSISFLNIQNIDDSESDC